MKELIKALDDLQEEKHIEKEVIIQAIEDSLVAACNRDYGKNAKVDVNMDRETAEITVYLQKTVVEEVEDDSCEISLEDAKMIDSVYEPGDVVNIKVKPKNFGRIAAQHARSVIVQKIKEEERRVLYEHFQHKEKDLVTGVVQRFNGKNICVSLDDKTDAVLTEKEQVKGEVFHPTDRIKLYVVEVKDTNKGPRILVSRTHKDLVKRLFEKEVAEVFEGIVEIKSIAREPGSRTKIAVASNDPNVDPVGACVGKNGIRVDAIVNDLQGEKIDIIAWSDDPAVLIKNALSPSNVVSVTANEEEKTARVVVPDYQLSLAIGKEGQNARLAARLTGYKIDIKSETQAAELEYEDYPSDENYDDYPDDSRDGDYPDDDYNRDRDYDDRDGNYPSDENYDDYPDDSRDGDYPDDDYDRDRDYRDDNYDRDRDYDHDSDYRDDDYDRDGDYRDADYDRDRGFDEDRDYDRDRNYDEAGDYRDDGYDGEGDELDDHYDRDDDFSDDDFRHDRDFSDDGDRDGDYPDENDAADGDDPDYY